jgi:hypothetical protein
MSFLSYLFWPNPGVSSYSQPKVMALLALCALLIAAAVALKIWRRKQQNQILRRLSRSWASASAWFGLIGLFLLVSRVEGVQYISMRFWWVVWLLSAAAYVYVQWKKFTLRYYEVLPTEQRVDPMDKYLPRRKKR